MKRSILFYLCVLAEASASRPNFVFVLTDDQDLVLNGLSPMLKTLELVANNGVTFENAFVNSPICCPSRSTILTGKFPHNTGVTNNSISGNCSSRKWQMEHEGATIASILKKQLNYRTFYAGKYLNQYGQNEVGGVSHVPPGYDWWFGLKGNSVYYNYTLSINGTGKRFQNEYLTDQLGSFALDFLRVRSQEPFFMMISPPAPHAPFTPASRHLNRFPNLTAVRTPSFNYTPINKHWLMQLPPIRLPSDVSKLDNIHRNRHQSLLAVDDLIENVISELSNLNILDDTYVIVTSDNGFHIGQFGQPWDKRQPYETDIRVPLLIRGPGVPKKRIVRQAVSSVDLAPTLLDLAGVQVPRDMDGDSFKSAIRDADLFEETFVWIEYFGEGNVKSIDDSCPWRGNVNLSECSLDNWCKCQDARNNTFSCVRHLGPNVNSKFCKFSDAQDFKEMYELNGDPYELINMSDGAIVWETYETIYEELQNCGGSSCRRKKKNKEKCFGKLKRK